MSFIQNSRISAEGKSNNIPSFSAKPARPDNPCAWSSGVETTSVMTCVPSGNLTRTVRVSCISTHFPYAMLNKKNTDPATSARFVQTFISPFFRSIPKWQL